MKNKSKLFKIFLIILGLFILIAAYNIYSAFNTKYCCGPESVIENK